MLKLKRQSICKTDSWLRHVISEDGGEVTITSVITRIDLLALLCPCQHVIYQNTFRSRSAPIQGKYESAVEVSKTLLSRTDHLLIRPKCNPKFYLSRESMS